MYNQAANGINPESAVGVQEPAEGEPVEREQKQVRMRAGFGVFAPSRVGRLLKEAKDSNDSATAVKTALQPSSRGSSTGADAPATQVQSICAAGPCCCCM